MRDLVQDLLTFAEVSMPAQLAGQSMNLHECIDWATENLEADIRDSGADVQWSGMPSVDRCFEGSRRVFQNLLGSASA